MTEETSLMNPSAWFGTCRCDVSEFHGEAKGLRLINYEQIERDGTSAYYGDFTYLCTYINTIFIRGVSCVFLVQFTNKKYDRCRTSCVLFIVIQTTLSFGTSTIGRPPDKLSRTFHSSLIIWEHLEDIIEILLSISSGCAVSTDLQFLVLNI